MITFKEGNKKYPLNPVIFSPDLRDNNYTIERLICTSEKDDYPDIVKDYDYPIHNQYNIGECVGCSMHSIASYTKNTQPNEYNMFSIGWIYGYRPDGYIRSIGMNARDAWKTATKVGLVRAKDFIYEAEFPAIEQKIYEVGIDKLLKLAAENKLDNYIWLYTSQDVKKYLNQPDSGICMLIIKAYENFYECLENGGTIPEIGIGDVKGSHAVALIGVKDGYYIFVNSWGPNVGDHGIFKISVNSNCIISIIAPVDKRCLREKPDDAYPCTWKKVTVDGVDKWEYYNNDCKRVVNDWVCCNNKWYLMDENGYCYDGKLVNNNGKYYYLLPGSCEMARDQFIESEGKTYYIGAEGYVVRNSWIFDNNHQYYLDDYGFVTKGIKIINHHIYYFGFTTGILKFKFPF